MASTLNIPGYYYDEEKKKYFKIEQSHTAPGSAAWSSDSVKKRRLEDEEAAKATRRMTLDKSRVARARILGHPLTGGFLDCEVGRPRPEIVSAGFAEGLVEKGKLVLKDARWTSTANVNHMYVDGQDHNTDMCVAYATTDEHSLISSYIPRDNNGVVHRRLLAHYQTPAARIAPYHELVVPQISDIKYHQPSNQVLVTSRSPGQDVVIWAFTPKPTGAAAVDDDTHTRPRWQLGWRSPGGNSVYRRINTQGDLKHHDYQANAVAPAPANSNQVCAIGTNRGVVRWVADGYRAWLTPRSFPSTPTAGRPPERNPYTDIFALDFQRAHPDVLLFGGRPGRMWISDCRQPRERWDVLSAGSPITHIKSVNEHQVLVAGLRDKLALYDLRFVVKKKDYSYYHYHYGHNPSSPPSSSSSSSWNNSRRNSNNRSSNNNKSASTAMASANAALPILTFPQYRNRAHVDIGLDVDVEGGSGVVAAAHDDGTVALYSARSGSRLRSPAAVDAVRSPRGPVQAVQFQTFPRDSNASLFVGVQSNVSVYSFGVAGLGDEA